MKKPKILFLTKYPKQGASSRYRVYQYLECFENIDFRVQSLLSDKSFELMYRRGSLFKKIFLGLKDYLKRTFFLLKNLNADIIYMQREIFAFGPLWAENLYNFLGKKLILDLDDALFINKKNKNNPFKWDKTSRVKHIITKTDLVIAGNTWIRDECKKIGAKKAIHIDVAERVQFETLERKKNKILKVVWLGSPTTSKYLFFIEQSLKKIQEEIGLEINIVGGSSDEEFAFKSKYIPWSLENEKKYLSISDIGLMPLPMENWSKGKCGGKARTYMASGVIPIVSNIGYNRDLIEHKKSGFLCTNEEDWYESLKFISSNVKLQNQIRTLNYDIVKSKFDKQNIAKTIENAIKSIE